MVPVRCGSAQARAFATTARSATPWLEAEFEVLKPEVVACLGATAAKALIAPSFRITKDRGQPIPWTPAGVEAATADPADEDEDAPSQTWILATTHPSAGLRTPDEGRAAAYDALDLRLAEPPPRRLWR
jgi:DNA polymerase